jgi:hypothetical protein
MTTTDLTRSAHRLRAEQVAAIVTHLQRDAVDRDDAKGAELLRMIGIWLNDVSAVAATADRSVRRVTCPKCKRSVPPAGIATELIGRVRQRGDR